MLARHRELAARFGNQAEQIVAGARQRRLSQELVAGEEARKVAQKAVTYARDRQIEREAVFNERDFLNDALRRSVGGATLKEIREKFKSRLKAGEFVDTGPSAAGWSYTTRQMLEIERANIAFMRDGQRRFCDPLAREHVQEQFEDRLRHLSDDQRRAIREILASHDQIVGLQGTAGAGKTTALAAIRDAAERQGYEVEGFAPTSRAAQQLEAAGIRSKTLQKFLAQGEQADAGISRLYFVDESSLASSKQVNEFLRRLHDFDRVIFVGDSRQHQGIEAGRPFEQLQNVGMRTARLDHIIRQRDSELKRAGRYAPGHIVRFTKGSQALKLKAGEYVRVTDSDPGTNLVTVKRANGKTVSYDPRRLQGVAVYQEVERSFSEGDRIQFTAPYRDKRIANRELGTVKEIRSHGTLSIQLDSGRMVEFSMRKHPHLDYGYAVTSHSSQGVTADRVLVNVDTCQAREKLLNSRFAYVSISRARFDAKIYTDNAQEIGVQLSREVSKHAAIENKRERHPARRRKQPTHEQSQGLGLSL